MYLPDRKPGPIVEALCWSHARRKFFELADIAAKAAPVALEAVKRIDEVFDIEREIVGLSAAECLRVRQERSVDLLTRHAGVAKAIDYVLKRGRRSPASSTMGASALPTMQPSERCVVSAVRRFGARGRASRHRALRGLSGNKASVRESLSLRPGSVRKGWSVLFTRATDLVQIRACQQSSVF